MGVTKPPSTRGRDRGRELMRRPRDHLSVGQAGPPSSTMTTDPSRRGAVPHDDRPARQPVRCDQRFDVGVSDASRDVAAPAGNGSAAMRQRITLGRELIMNEIRSPCLSVFLEDPTRWRGQRGRKVRHWQRSPTVEALRRISSALVNCSSKRAEWPARLVSP